MTPSLSAVSETFIRAHIERLPNIVAVIHSLYEPRVGDRHAASQSLPARAVRKLYRIVTRKPWDWEITHAIGVAIRRARAQAVLAEYGPTGILVAEVCQRLSLPLIVHFHGYDASVRDVLEQHRESYRKMFATCQAVVGVSKTMCERLRMLGADPNKVYYNPYGVDCEQFQGAAPERAPPVFVAVGRFVEKKAPHLTLLAFAEVVRREPQARLRLIGEGPLLGVCQQIAAGLGIARSVAFLGAQAPDVVAAEMRAARAFVQHSIEASNGDCEGTPVGVLEAQATGLPVVATRHAGIPDVVQDGETGYLVAERDVPGMAERMYALAVDPALAGRLGKTARQHIASNFNMQQRLDALADIIRTVASPKNKARGTPSASTAAL